MSDYLTLAMELSLHAVTPYSNFDFDSFCRFNGKCLAANKDGIFVLGGDADNGTEISAYLKIGPDELGRTAQKRVRMAYIGAETTGALRLTVETDEQNERAYTFKPMGSAARERSARLPIGRGAKGRYWSFKISNVSGCYFALDTLSVMPVVHGKEPNK